MGKCTSLHCKYQQERSRAEVERLRSALELIARPGAIETVNAAQVLARMAISRYPQDRAAVGQQVEARS
jgi:hypothetical protein